MFMRIKSTFKVRKKNKNMKIIKAHAVKNLCYIAAKKMKPAGIVVHSTGANNPNLKRYVDAERQVGKNIYGNHWNAPMPDGRKVCVHAFIGYDKDNNVRVAEILPLDICCWGVGEGRLGSYNFSPAYIQFEICEDNCQDAEYYKKAFGVAASYAAHLCRQWNISVKNIVSHREAYLLGYGCNHGDPEHWMKNFGETMDDFRSTVSAILDFSGGGDHSLRQQGENQCAFKNGDLVSIASNAVYYSGEPVPSWVQSYKWYVKGKPQGERVVIDKNETGTHTICSPIHAKFLSIVKNGADGIAENTNTIVRSYLVKITADSLPIYADADIHSKTVGQITNGGVYTIVSEKAGEGAEKWGRLKSGVGWILLNHVKRLN